MGDAVLEADLRSIPRLSPFQYRPHTCKAILRAKAVKNETPGASGDPTGTRYGFANYLGLFDPRDWINPASNYGVPVEWALWQQMYQYFTVTKVWVQQVWHGPAWAFQDQDAQGFLEGISRYGGKISHELFEQSSVTNYRAQYANQDDWYMRSKLLTRDRRPKFWDYYPRITVMQMGGTTPTFPAQSFSIPVEPGRKVVKSFWNLLDWYERHPMDVDNGLTQPYSTWLPTNLGTSHTTNLHKAPYFWYGWSENNPDNSVDAAHPSLFYIEHYITWEVVFTGAITTTTEPT